MWWKSRATKKAIEKLKTANELIGMLRENKVSHVEHFVFNSRLEVRSVHDDEPFKKLGSPNVTEQDLLNASDARVMLTTRLEEGSPRFRLYLFGDVIAYNDKIYGECVDSVIHRTFASVGLSPPDDLKKRIAEKLGTEEE